MNTKERHREIYAVAVDVLAQAGGVLAIDTLAKAERVPTLRKLYKQVETLAECHYDVAKCNVAKALRRARYDMYIRIEGENNE